MRSALTDRLTSLGLKHKKKEGRLILFDTWHSGSKGDGFAPQQNGVRYFSFQELQMYTNNFSDESNLLGQGSFAKVYIGYLPNNGVVAIKRAKTEFCRGIRYFKNEIELLSRVHHKNIVSFVGFCLEQEERLLVFKYICMGSLNDCLHGITSTYLDWQQRLQIALDAARGLSYLHELADPQIIHGDVKPRNILLDENLSAKISAFGLSKINRDKKEVYIDIFEGTGGYVDPVYRSTNQLSEKCDVYSFGVVILELITAKHPKMLGGYDLINMVVTAMNQYDQEYFGLRDIIDPKILSQARNISLRKFVLLALACLKESPSDRPFMSEVMKEIDVILQNYGNGRMYRKSSLS